MNPRTEAEQLVYTLIEPLVEEIEVLQREVAALKKAVAGKGIEVVDSVVATAAASAVGEDFVGGD